MNQDINYFPLGLAEGKAFCNRISERKQLIQNIQKNTHTLVISPRRYGKSSLILYTLNELKLPYERVDLFVAVSTKTIEEQILKSVKTLITKITSTPEQFLELVKSIIHKLKIKWMVGTDGINVELIPEKNSDSSIVIMESLLMLENVLVKKKIKAIFFIDEFQEIGTLCHHEIEGAIRHVAEKSKYLNFIFSGSKRHVLENMFDDRSRPLYMLCDRITIDRIHEHDYRAFLNNVSEKTWGKAIFPPFIDAIFTCTERHPHYMNVLCSKLWDVAEARKLTLADVNKNWLDYVLQEESKTAREISLLNISQKKILIAIAHGLTKDLTGKSALAKFKLTSAAIVKSLKHLEKEDYIHRDENGAYSVLDPLIKASLVFFYPRLF